MVVKLGFGLIAVVLVLAIIFLGEIAAIATFQLLKDGGVPISIKFLIFCLWVLTGGCFLATLSGLYCLMTK